MPASFRRRTVASVLFLVSFLFAGAPRAHGQGSQEVWARIAGIPETVSFADVVMVSEGRAWAVGGEQAGTETLGVAYQLQLHAGRWRAAREAVFPRPLRTVDAVSERQIWAAGERGLIVMRDDAGWREVRNTSSSINTIEMLRDGAEGWAAGEVPTSSASTGPFLLRYANGRWTLDPAITAPSGGGINSLSFAGETGWAVGNTNIWRYAGGRWQQETAPRPCPGDNCFVLLSDVFALSDQDAWAAGIGTPRCQGCNQSAYILRRAKGSWSVAPVPAFDRPELQQDTELEAIHFAGSNRGWAVGRLGSNDFQPLVLSYRDGAWTREQTPGGSTQLTAITSSGPARALVAGDRGTILSYGYGAQPADPQLDPSGKRCFPETGQCIGGRFRQFWEQNGGLPVFGFPIAAPRYEINRDSGQIYVTQWFERNRFEQHPELAAPYDVLLGRLGDERLRQSGVDWQTQPRASGPQPGCRWFPETRRNVCDQAPGAGFKTYWETYGLKDPRLNRYGQSLALFGLPLTEPRMETNASGDTVLTQWFERARLEWHPNKPNPYRVLLGLLGNEVRR